MTRQICDSRRAPVLGRMEIGAAFVEDACGRNYAQQLDDNFDFDVHVVVALVSREKITCDSLGSDARAVRAEQLKARMNTISLPLACSTF